MIPLDPEEIFGSAIWDAVKRVALAFFCLFLGSFLGLLAVGIPLFLASLISPSTYSIAFEPAYLAFLFVLPIIPAFSYWVVIVIPNIIFTLLYVCRGEEIRSSHLLVFTGIQQFASTAFLGYWPISEGRFSLLGFSIWVFYFIYLALLIFASWFLQHFFRRQHEHHLLNVAAETAVRTHHLKNKKHIPPPPASLKSPSPPKLE